MKQKSQDNKILLIDIEISPACGWTWGPKFDTSIIEFIEPWYILSVAYKWLGQKCEVIAIDTHSEKEVVKKIHQLLSSCEVAVAHNGDKFDFKKLNTRFLHFGLAPPPPFRTIDTRTIARQRFGFYSNSLNDIAKELGIGEKVHHEGFALWKRCMARDKGAFVVMKKYNVRDVELLERVYLRFRPWIKNHPHISDGSLCSRCGSDKIQSRGFRRTVATIRKRYQCQNCLGWMSSLSGEMVSSRRSI